MELCTSCAHLCAKTHPSIHNAARGIEFDAREASKYKILELPSHTANASSKYVVETKGTAVRGVNSVLDARPTQHLCLLTHAISEARHEMHRSCSRRQAQVPEPPCFPSQKPERHPTGVVQ